MWDFDSGNQCFEYRWPCDPTFKQTYAKEGQLLGYKAGRYAHARQFRRMRKVIQRQSTIVGRSSPSSFIQSEPTLASPS